MNHARLASSPRLRRVHDLLRDGVERTTLEISLGARVCAVNSAIAELRENGAVIRCRQGRSPEGARLWFYRMVAPAPEVADA